ncbi:hypothetical protein N2152v2_005888 [Parachlorella kessleri]
MVSKSYVVEVGAARPATDSRPAQGPVYKAALHTKLVLPESPTLYENFTEAVAKFGTHPCLGHRSDDSYSYISYNEAGETAAALGSAMVHVGLQPHARCSVFGANSPEWMLTMQACNRQTIYCVPLYDSLGDDTVDYVIEHSESSIVFVSAAKLPVLAKGLPRVAERVKHVVYWGEVSSEAQAALQAVQELHIPVYTFEAFAQLGKAHPALPVAPKPDDIATIMYTSGTTGTPKVNINIGPGDVYLSFLPLAHIYDRCMEETFLRLGGSIAYWGGDVRKLAADIKACQPTIFCSVPRIFERFHSVVMDKVKSSGFIKRSLFNWAFNRKLAALQAGYAWDKASPRFDRMIFKAMSKQLLGGRIRLITSGGAPLSRTIEDFMRVTSCAIFLQGYGLTETCAASFVNHPDEPDHFYTVGPPQPAFELRLEAVSEMGYDPLATPPRGEVLIKGGGVFSGYYKNEEETRKAVDGEGWFHSGDVGELTPTGALRIIERKKNIFKLSQGEYIAVEKVEGALAQCPLVEQLWVHGSHFESCLVAVVVPAKDKLEGWAKEHGVHGSSGELCGKPEVKQALLQEVSSTGKKLGLKGYELPKAIYVEEEPFSVANDLITPTFKLRRPQLVKKYTGHIDAMYGAMKSA